MHLNSIKLQNFRVFTNLEEFRLSPLTVLTGPNNSGKSSFIKALLLLKDSLAFQKKIDDKTPYFDSDIKDYKINPLPTKLIFANNSKHYLDGMESIIPFDQHCSDVIVSLPLNFAELKKDYEGTIELHYRKHKASNYLKKAIISKNKKVLAVLTYSMKEDKTQLSSLSIDISFVLELYNSSNYMFGTGSRWRDRQINTEKQKSKISGKTDSKNYNSSFVTFSSLPFYNNFQAKPSDDASLFCIDDKMMDNDTSREEISFSNALLKGLESKYIETITGDNGLWNIDLSEKNIGLWSNTIHGLVSRNFHSFLVNSFRKGESQQAFSFSSHGNIDYMLDGKTTPNTYEVKFSNYGDLIIGFFDRLLRFNFNNYHELFSSIRYYPNPDVRFEKLVSEEDRLIFELLRTFHEIQNEQIAQEEYEYNYSPFYFINVVLNEFQIAKSIEVNQIKGYGYEVLLKQDNNSIKLKDCGYGVRKLVSILLLIASNAHKSKEYYSIEDQSFKKNIIIFEEPESNLHPKFQSLLADMLIIAARIFNTQFIIESHSEYFIRKLQYLTATDKELDEEDICIYYFYEPDYNIPANRIVISKDGSLSDEFGTGFFDEADNLAIDLFNLKKAQKN